MRLQKNTICFQSIFSNVCRAGKWSLEMRSISGMVYFQKFKRLAKSRGSIHSVKNSDNHEAFQH